MELHTHDRLIRPYISVYEAAMCTLHALTVIFGARENGGETSGSGCCVEDHTEPE